MDEGELRTIMGWEEKLDEQRKVFVGYNPDDPTDKHIYLRFDNEERKTYLKLSREAMQAVINNWATLLKYEENREQQSWLMKVIVKYVGAAQPFSFAGLPPVEDPGTWWSTRFSEISNEWKRVENEPPPDTRTCSE